MMNNSLEEFYGSWSDNSERMIKYHNEAAVRKVEAMFNMMPILSTLKFQSILDFGCGFGKVMQHTAERMGVKEAYGFDFSEQAIDYANGNFSTDKFRFSRLQTLQIDENIESIKQILCDRSVDCILLIDLLEHIPNCQELIFRLSELTEHFIIKLPIEANVIDNYILRKTYPSTIHYNGHLREFTTNSVYYFIRKLGLTPIAEGVRIYDFKDSYPPREKESGLGRRLGGSMLKWARKVLSRVLPVKLYLRLIGPGFYYCIATFNKEYMLNP